MSQLPDVCERDLTKISDAVERYVQFSEMLVESVLRNFCK